MSFVKTCFLTFIALLASLIVIIFTYFKWSHGYWNRKGVLTPKPCFPYGNAKKQFLGQETVGQSVEKIYKEFKSQGLRYCGYYSLVKPTLILLDLDLIKTVMTKDFVHFMDRGLYNNENNDPMTANLLALKGIKWRILRAKLTPTFTSGKMKMMFPTLMDCASNLVDVMDETVGKHLAIEMKDITARFATDVIGSCAFGLDCDTLKNPNSEFLKYGQRAFELNKNKLLAKLKMITLASCPMILDFLKIPLFPRDISNFFLKTVRETVKYREENGIIRKDFMHLLIQLKNNVKVSDEDHSGSLFNENEQISQKTLSIEQITAQCFVFFLGGFETASTTLPFFFYEMACDQELQNRVRAEIIKLLEANDGNLTYDALADLTYMEMCINETLRKYPPLPILARECSKAYKVPKSNLIVDKGTKIFVPVLGIQHDPEYYPEPEKFDPERFNLENKAKRHHFSWLGFGEGPRSCIGQRFGMMEMKIAVLVLLKNYKFTLSEKTCTPLVMNPISVIPYVKGGIWLNIKRI